MTKTESRWSEQGKVIATFARARHGEGWKQSDVARDTGLGEMAVSRALRSEGMSLRTALSIQRAYRIGDISILAPGFTFTGREPR